MTNHLELLKRSDVFRGLSDEQLEQLLALTEERTFAEGDVLVEEDSKAECCFFVVQGRIDIEVRGPFPGGGPQKLATIKRGEMCGELSLVDGFLRSASARAMEEVLALRFENAKLEELMTSDPHIGYRVMRNVANVLASRIRNTNMKLRNALADIFYY